jgi:CheY-like chemotaxis protein
MPFKKGAMILAKTRIMIVEDEWVVANDLKASLERLGYDVYSIALSAEEAIKEAEQKKPDLVLMDVVLPGEMDGIKTAHEIGSRFDIPVIYLSAYADEDKLKRAKITEPFAYLIKAL